MPFVSPTTLLDVLAVAAFVALTNSFNHRRQSSRLPYPPGPRGIPIIGHFLTFPKNFVWLTFTEWGQKYGMKPVSQMFLALRRYRGYHVRPNLGTSNSHSKLAEGSQGLA
jgi:hypothetical protein